MKVGFAGLGNMGGGMARNVLAAGFELLVYNRTREKAEALEGAVVEDSALALAQKADLVLTCLADIDVTRDVFLREDGLLAGASEGKIFVDHGTVDLATSRDLSSACEERGASFLDAPISGGPEGASAGTLAIMVGGGQEIFERARPVFEAMGSKVVHMGPTGAGTATKLANQLLVGVNSLACCEALTMARQVGVDLEQLQDVLANAWGQSRMLERCGPIIAREGYDEPGAPLRNILKDLTIITRLGRDSGLSVKAADAALGVFQRLVEEGMGESDMTAACRCVSGEMER